MKKFLLIFLILTTFLTNGQKTTSYKLEQRSTNSFNPLTDILGWFVSEVTYGIMIESFLEKNTPMHRAGLTPYPFFHSKEGNYTYNNLSVPFRIEVSSNLMLGHNFQKNGNIIGKIRFAKRLDLSATYNQLFKTGLKNEYHSQTSFILNYHRIRTRQVDIWYGLGIMFSENKHQSSGVAYNLGAELFLPAHLNLQGQINWAYLEPEFIKNYQIQLGYFLSHWRLQGGIKNFRLPYKQLNTIELGIKYYF